MFGGKDFSAYGSTTVGERGQVVLPVKIREKFKIMPGDKFLVVGAEHHPGAWGVILIKSDILSRLISKVFGGELGNILKGKK